MPLARKKQQSASLQAWRKYLPLLDSVLVSDWTGLSSLLHATDFSRENFLSFVAENDLASALQWLVNRDDASAKLPSWLLLHLMGSAAYGVRRTQEQSGALGEIVSSAAQTELNFILLKGLHIAERFYGSVDARWVRDLDLLVKATDQARFCRLLTGLGYEPQNLEWLPKSVHYRLIHASNWQRGNLAVDLHHDFRVRPGYRIDMERIFAASQKQIVAGIHVAVPSDEDSLLLLIVSIASDIEQGRVHSKSLVDLWAVLTKLEGCLNWETFLAERRNEGLYRLFIQVLLLFMAGLPLASKFPGLIEAIQKHVIPGQTPDQEDALDLFSAPLYSLSNRRWFLRHYEGNKLAYLCWWLIGGLFRPGSVVALGRALWCVKEHQKSA